MESLVDEWNDIVLPQLLQLLHSDDFYQELRSECSAQEKSYQEILDQLNDAQQEQLERYISCCEDMEYRKAQLAYQLGKLHSSIAPQAPFFGFFPGGAGKKHNG